VDILLVHITYVHHNARFQNVRKETASVSHLTQNKENPDLRIEI